MVLELVHRLATDDSAAIKKILDNVILLLVPSLNPDGQIMVTDWYNKTLGTPSEASPLPYLYHPYTGHDNNRDMYLFSPERKPDGGAGPVARVVPLHLAGRASAGQRRSAHLHHAGHRPDQSQRGSADLPAERRVTASRRPRRSKPKARPASSSTPPTPTSGRARWRGPDGGTTRSGMLTEVASARIATPVVQLKADPSAGGPAAAPATGGRGAATGPRAAPTISKPSAAAPSNVPTIRCPRRATPAAHRISAPLAGRPLDPARHRGLRTDRHQRAARQPPPTAAKRCSTRSTTSIATPSKPGKKGEIGQDKEKSFAILIPADGQHDPNEAIELVDKLLIAGVEVYRAQQGFKQDDKTLSRPEPS